MIEGISPGKWDPINYLTFVSWTSFRERLVSVRFVVHWIVFGSVVFWGPDSRFQALFEVRFYFYWTNPRLEWLHWYTLYPFYHNMIFVYKCELVALFIFCLVYLSCVKPGRALLPIGIMGFKKNNSPSVKVTAKNCMIWVSILKFNNLSLFVVTNINCPFNSHLCTCVASRLTFVVIIQILVPKIKDELVWNTTPEAL